jgi:hypothetical protein
MIVSSAATYNAVSPASGSINKNNNSQAVSFANLLDNISQSSSAKIAALSEKTIKQTSATYSLDTQKGKQLIDLEAYFNPDPGSVNFDTALQLAESPENIAVIAGDASKRMHNLLVVNGIPEAPVSIKYDQMGQIVLPDDYKHADKFREAIKNDQVLSQELRFIYCAAEFQVNIQDSLKYQKEYLAAKSDICRKAVNNRYSYLLSGQQLFKSVDLIIDSNGMINPVSEGRPYSDYLSS